MPAPVPTDVESAAIAKTTPARNINLLIWGLSFGQTLGVLDVVGRLPDPALRVLDGVAEPVVEAGS